MNRNPFGFQSQIFSGIVRDVQRAQPVVVKLIDPDSDICRAIKQASPQTCACGGSSKRRSTTNMERNQLVSIYALSDPITQMAMYIGQTVKPNIRMGTHVWSRYALRTQTSKWIASLTERGYRPEMIVLEEVPSQEANNSEKWWIEYMRYLGCNLTNTTAGGAGAKERKCSEQTKQRLSDAMKTSGRAQEARRLHGIRRRGMKLGPASQSRRQKISEANKKRVLTEETKKKISASLSGKRMSDETKRKSSLSHTGLKQSVETRQLKSEIMKRIWAERKANG